MIKMFIHNFKYSLKILFKNKMLLFWTYVFPLVLGTFFYLAFSSIEENEKLDIIDIGIINNNEFIENEIYKNAFKELSDENNKNRLFDIKYIEKEKAKKLLEENKITGYLEIKEGSPKITIKENGINETIFKYIVEQINETTKMITNITDIKIKEELIKENYNIDYDNLYKEVLNIINENEIEIKNISNNNLSYTMIEYYTLIAMTCLYGGVLSMTSINANLANMSNKGKRMSISPTKKQIVITSSLLASYLAQLLGLVILFIYTLLVLKVDYGSNILQVVILSLIGSLAGLSLGTFVGTTFKTGENTKVGILISITMIGCFLSGMMGITMKYIVDKNIHILNLINPASMITDGFYSLYYYDTLNRYYLNIISLIIFSIILLLISFVNIRRQKYDSI